MFLKWIYAVGVQITSMKCSFQTLNQKYEKIKTKKTNKQTKKQGTLYLDFKIFFGITLE